jgi:protein involved in polysaccharide export with SLBB domain
MNKSHHLSLHALALVAAIVLLTPKVRAADTAAPAAAAGTGSISTMDTLDDKYKLTRGDALSFRVVEDAQDPRDPLTPNPPLVVTDSGDVDLPYIGQYPASGKTCKQLANEVKVALEKKYYYRATVILALVQNAKSNGHVYVNGQVRATGAVDMPGDEILTVSRAIMIAGGFTDYADKQHVQLTRPPDATGLGATNTVVNVKQILEKGKSGLDPKVLPGDMIFVPSRLISF